MSEHHLFVGIVNFYVRYLLLGQWTENSDNAFRMVKNNITSHQELTHYDPLLPLCFATLPSLNGLEAILRHIRPDERRTNRLNTSGSLCPSEKVKLFTKREGSSGYYLLKKAIYLLCL